ncbi:putative PurR-regulated permease PerM [Microbacterium sp. BE35]|uniref:hypothetical protein n=1 Tax=Microbacterium sp. BE35 TaxID=2817773 RepID=UPI002863986F|nr:hypothetical protein [Microbacterium sp. BE35]MDR7190704.1 putative PurR-regulated permease PerM [Microbacterium sp. BE35]
METKSVGALAACVAGLAVVLCVLSVALALPMAVEIAVITGALALLASAGGLIGAALAAQKKSGA